ncbi:unnamed protein product [Rotaria magnacalcarata]|uniref:Uncharacterized protein n=1 Tax=Rotaria magnacalcarata TaxID=392030 RepID=A0A8S2UME2_9BILA|nr:unnamed protein product [Rotaria magnacalcarata]
MIEIVSSVCLSKLLVLYPQNNDRNSNADYVRVEQSIAKALNATLTPQDLIINNPSASFTDVKKTTVAALQTLQSQLSTSTMQNGTLIDGNNTSAWTNTLSQPLLFLPT